MNKNEIMQMSDEEIERQLHAPRLLEPQKNILIDELSTRYAYKILGQHKPEITISVNKSDPSVLSKPITQPRKKAGKSWSNFILYLIVFILAVLFFIVFCSIFSSVLSL